MAFTLPRYQSTVSSTAPHKTQAQARYGAAAARAPRLHGLDSLRALAVLLVVIYHLLPGVLPGGFIGVDIFFVLSGFLITSLLVQEWQVDSRISLRSFWARRVRRIVPALVLVVVVMTALAGIIGGDALVGIRRQLLGALTFSSNWLAIASGGSYADQFVPDLFNNLWSLAVEEQFYVLWPLVIVLLTLRARRGVRRGRLLKIGLLISGAVAILSVGLMAWVFAASGNASRVYLGTDTHVFGLMIGAAVAFVLRPDARQRWPRVMWGPFASPVATVRRFSTIALATSLILIIGVAALTIPFDSALWFGGGLFVVDVAVAVLLVLIVGNQRWAQRIEVAPLRWVGRRSYGLYLWHWPIIVLATQVMQGQGTSAGLEVRTVIVALVFTLVASAASYTWLERPIIEQGLRGFVDSVSGWTVRLFLNIELQRTVAHGRSLSERAARLLRAAPAVGVSILVIALCAGVAAALTREPAISSVESVIAQGQDFLENRDFLEDFEQQHVGSSKDDSFAALQGVLVRPGQVAQNKTPQPADGKLQEQTAAKADANASNDAAEKPAPDSAAKPSSDAAAKPAPAPSAKPKAPSGKQVTVIGDSVTLASAPGLVAALPGVTVDAEVSRMFSEAPKIVENLKKQGKLQEFVVISLGTNGTVRARDIARVRASAGDRQIILVTGHAERKWIKGANKSIKAAAKKYDNVSVADWNSEIAHHESELAADGIHPGVNGGKRYAKVVKQALALANTQLGAAAKK